MILESGKLKVEFIQSAFSRTRYDNTGLIRQVWLHTDGGDVPFCTVQNLIPGFSSDGAGLANEFNIEDPPGFREAAPGGEFLKIGVGWCLRPDDSPYRFTQDYEVTDRGTLLSESFSGEDGGTGVRILWRSGERGGYGCILRKEFLLRDRRIRVGYELTNSGTKPLWNYEYAHNFVAVGDTPVEEGMYDLTTTDPMFDRRYEGELITYDQFPSYCSTYVSRKCENVRGWTLRRVSDGVSVSETIDFVPSRVAVWAMPHVISPEIFIECELAPGETKSWTRTYSFSGGPGTD